MKSVSYQCEILPGGKLPGPISRAIRSVLQGAIGKVITISIQEETKLRSLRQNRYYWGCVVTPIHAMFIKYGNNKTKDQVHEFLKQEVCESMFRDTILLPDGSRRHYFRSSTELTVKEWEDFMEMVRAWAAQWEIIIPLPNEVLEAAGD